MKPRQCAGCAAPLPAGDPAGSVTCGFCGMVHDPATSGGSPLRVEVHSRPVVRAPRRFLGIVIAVALVVTLVPLAIVFYVARQTTSTISSALTNVNTSATTPARSTVLAMADLKRPLPSGPQPIDVAPPSSGYAAADPVALLPWAVTIAQAWQPDARLRRIDVTRIRPDGTVNLVDDAEAELRYRFESPGRREELRRQADLSASAELVMEFWVAVRQGKPQVQALSRSASALRRGDTLPPHPKVLPTTTLWPRLTRRTGYDAPFLTGYLIYLDREGWVWYLSSLSGAVQPRVRATDGRSYPY